MLVLPARTHYLLPSRVPFGGAMTAGKLALAAEQNKTTSLCFGALKTHAIMAETSSVFEGSRRKTLI